MRDRNIYCQLKFEVENLEMSLMIPSGLSVRSQSLEEQGAAQCSALRSGLQNDGKHEDL